MGSRARSAFTSDGWADTTHGVVWESITADRTWSCGASTKAIEQPSGRADPPKKIGQMTFSSPAVDTVPIMTHREAPSRARGKRRA